MACNGLENIGVPGECTLGYDVGLIIFNSHQKIDIESAKIKSTWEDLAKIAPKENLMYIPFAKSEVTQNETVTETLIGGKMVVVDEKQGMDKFSILGDECAFNSIYEKLKNGVQVQILYVTSGGFIRGKFSPDKKSLETIKAYIQTTTLKATETEIAKVTLNVQALEDWIGISHGVAVDFDFSSIELIKNIYTAGIVGTTSEITFDLFYCGHIPNADANESSFIVTDSSGQNQTVTGTKNGNKFTLTGTFVSGETYFVSYDPTVNSDFMYLSDSYVLIP